MAEITTCLSITTLKKLMVSILQSKDRLVVGLKKQHVIVFYKNCTALTKTNIVLK
jgi:hypothetical protein